MRKRIVVVFIVVVPLASAQNPIEVRRVPTTPPPLLQQYDFGAQLSALPNPDAVPPSAANPRSPGASVPPPQQPPLPAQKAIHEKDVPLDRSEQEAIKVSERWRSDGTPPAAGPDGRVLYSYGA